jgi:hypothetical protein
VAELRLTRATIDADGLVYRLAQIATDKDAPMITIGRTVHRLADELGLTGEFLAEVTRQLEINGQVAS